MIIIFDLDGVLVNARDVHYECLNKALESAAGPEFKISREDHLTTFDGLSTCTKLDKLVAERGLDKELLTSIWLRKQDYTKEIFATFPADKELRDMLVEVKNLGVKLYCASNSISDTVELALRSLGIIDLFDGLYGNDNVVHIKPAPDVYFKCMMDAGASVHDTLIVEDSPIGRKAAKNAGTHILFVNNRDDLNIDKLLESISRMVELPKQKVKKPQMNVLIPMAGLGSRFTQAGYSFPKPLIEVDGKPMIQAVVDSLNIQANFVYIVQTHQYNQFHLKYLLNLITPNCKIIQVDGMTCGAACHSLLAKEHINNETPLLICNSDQIIGWNPETFFHSVNGADGSILTFKSSHPKWSYAKLGDDGYVKEVAEKIPISDNATVGIYYWKEGRQYVKYAEQMLTDNSKRVNNEFYICPVFNEAIKDGLKFKIFPVTEMYGLGTPEDLERYLNKNDSR